MQQRDRYRSAEDFLTDPSFRAWVLSGNDPDHWETWTVDHPQRAVLVEKARNLWLAMQIPDTNPSPEETASALESTWQKIEQAKNTVVTPLWRRWWRSAAAMLLLGGGLSLAWYMHSESAQTPGISYTELVKEAAIPMLERNNDTARPQLITLSDGSSVLLQPNSKLSYPATFESSQRIVYLSGEGFFEISKNPEQPFLVYASELVTKVVGTSFRVKAFADQEDIEVVVRTGKVNVSSSSAADNPNTDVLLLPNQGVRFSRQSLAFEKIDDLTQEKHISLQLSNIERLSFEFSDVPVAQIFRTIEQAYLVEIDFPKEKLKNCYLTTSLNDEPLPQKLKIICASLGTNSTYEIIDNQIIIKSEGCN